MATSNAGERSLGEPGICSRGETATVADHFMECPDCGEMPDMRDLGQVFDHIHEPDGDRARAVTRRPEPAVGHCGRCSTQKWFSHQVHVGDPPHHVTRPTQAGWTGTANSNWLAL